MVTHVPTHRECFTCSDGSCSTCSTEAEIAWRDAELKAIHANYAAKLKQVQMLYAAVGIMRESMNRAHMSITLALQVREDVELRGALDELEQALAVRT